MINTVTQLIEAIGGNTSAATAFGTTKPSICNWKAEDRFPAWALPRLTDIAQRNKLVLDPAMFETRQPKPERRKPAARKPRAKARPHSHAAE